MSSTPPGSTCTSEASGVLELVLLVKLRPGDQVMFDPRSIDAGEIVTAGKQLLHAPVGEALPAVAAQRHRAPAVALGEVERAGDLLGVEQRIDRVAAG